VARDRQRAKQRKRRQPGGGGSPPGSSRARAARDNDPEPTEVEKPEPTEVEPTEVEPTDTVFPRAGAVRPEGTRRSEPTDIGFTDAEEAELDKAAVEPTPDELDPAVYDERAEARPGRKKRGRILTFLGHVIDELRRVQWPDRRHVGQGTAVVLGFVVIAGGFLGLMDALWKPLIEAIL
jgi:preprotein translocase SecE subunit